MYMYSLFVDTHDVKVCLVLFKDEEILAIKELESNMRHSEIAMPSLVAILDENKLNPRDLSEIIVNVGPGSFTGVRIGVVIAKTMAYLLNIPIKTVNSLEIIAFSSDDIISGIYAISEKNGYFVGKCNNKMIKDQDVRYYSEEEFKDNFVSTQVNIDGKVDYKKMYLHAKNKSFVNPHLVNPLYVKKIEVLKWLLNLTKSI